MNGQFRGRPRVVLVAHDVHDAGGMERVCSELIRRGSGRYRFLVVSNRLDPELRRIAEWERVAVPRRPVPIKFVAFFLLAGLRLSRIRADVRHTVGGIVPNRIDIASVHFCHAGYRDAVGTLAPTEGSLPRRANTAIARGIGLLAERWCFRAHRVRTLAAVSNGVAAELRRHYSAARVVTTANGVDTDRYRPDAVLRDDVRRREGVQPTELVSLFVGGDWNHKGLAVAILGIGELERASVCDVRLWVVGRGDEERLRRLARSCGVEARVRFFGQQADPRRFYQAADLFLMPSRYEAFSLAMLEAAASGLPLVTTPVNGTAELVGDDAGGIIIERSPAAVAAAIARLRSEPSLRTRMGAAARERSLPYGWGESIDSILDEYARRLGSIPGIDR